MTPDDFLKAARCPETVQPQKFGVWTIQRQAAPNDLVRRFMGSDSWTYLAKLTMATLHLEEIGGEVVMEDSRRELRRHLPIWLAARGRVLITGLGLGCVLRGLLANPDVEHVDVVEIDAGIIRAIGPEFAFNQRVTIHHADALKLRWPAWKHWDFVWHDIHDDDGSNLHLLHIELLAATRRRCAAQGAWQLPRLVKRLWRDPLIGAARHE